MSKRLLLLAACALTLAVSSCGYFNTLYNARRQFSQAERARRRGEPGTARTDYIGSIEKAARSYRKHPRGRWSDDALYLIARARFQLGEYAAARAAAQELLGKTADREMRAGAHAYAGAASVVLAAPAEAGMHLDSAVAQLGSGSELFGFARLWRARAHVALGDVPAAWADLDAVRARDDQDFTAVQLERIGLAIENADTTRTADAFARALLSHDVRRRLDTLNVLALSAAERFGAERVRAMLLPQGDWSPPARDSLALIRARIADRAGDTLTANREFLDIAAHSALATASAARVAAARARLHGMTRLEQLNDVRSLLLPAISDADAQVLIRTIRLVDVLVRRSAQTGQPLALFAAAEIARDELGAPLLARQLFVTFADIGAQTPWAGKALLAAIAVEPNASAASELRSRLAALPPNPYTSIVQADSVDNAYDVAEERLDRSLAGLRAEAARLAQQQETGVTRMVFVLDSIRLAARADTMRASCGLMVDTLALVGIRADSVRAACLRGETKLLAVYLKADTLKWIHGAALADTVRKNTSAKPDTTRN